MHDLSRTLLLTRLISSVFLIILGTVPRADAVPNIITIVTDDQGQWAMGAYGNEDIHTPAMDRIAAEGALFTRAFVVSPVCSPARATFLSGRYPTELGITDWINPEDSADGLGLGAPTWVEVLQDHGYDTALFGKWHLGSAADHHPTQKGYDHFMGFLLGGTKPVGAELEVNGVEEKVDGVLPDRLTDAALTWLETVTKQDAPFHVSLHFRAPHLPYGPVPKEDTAPYDGKTPAIPSFPGVDQEKVRTSTSAYYASITSVDRNIARLLDYLDANDLTKDTIVLFTSDHGYNEGRHGINTKGNGHWIAGGVNGPKRPNIWDTSISVPLAIRWPGVIKSGTRYRHMVSNLDMYRTVLGMAEIPIANEDAIHGADFSALLRGEGFPEDRTLFGQYDLHNGGLAYLRMIRMERYKYVRHFHSNLMDELYDLQKDPDERDNLYRKLRRQGDPDGIIADLQKKLLEEMKQIDDPLLKDAY